MQRFLPQGGRNTYYPRKGWKVRKLCFTWREGVVIVRYVPEATDDGRTVLHHGKSSTNGVMVERETPNRLY